MECPTIKIPLRKVMVAGRENYVVSSCHKKNNILTVDFLIRKVEQGGP